METEINRKEISKKVIIYRVPCFLRHSEFISEAHLIRKFTIYYVNLKQVQVDGFCFQFYRKPAIETKQKSNLIGGCFL